jgi:hypothetical protein
MMLNAVSMNISFHSGICLLGRRKPIGCELYTFRDHKRKILLFSYPLSCNIQSRLRIITAYTTKYCG